MWARQFKSRERAERYIKEHNEGHRTGRVDATQSKLLDYDFGAYRFSVDHYRGRTQVHKQATADVTIGGKPYRKGWFVPFARDEDKDFRDLTAKMLDEDRKREDERLERTRGTVKK